MSSAFRLFPFSLVLCLALFACGRSTPSQSTSLPPVVATVKGRPIPTKLFEMYLKNGIAELGIDQSSEDGRRKLDQLREGIVSELIDRALIAQEAESRGLSIPAEKMAEADRQSIEQLGGQQRYEAYLAEHRLSPEEYRETVKNQIYGELLRAELNKGIAVSEDEIAKYYDVHQNEPAFQHQEQVTAAHILVAARPNVITQQLQTEKALTGEALTKAVKDEMERRRQRAVDLRRKANAQNFADLALQSSDDQGTRESGGDLGTFGRGSHPASFDDAAFKLKSGGISEVVQTEYGFHIIRISKHESQRIQTLAEAKPEIQRRLFAEREAKNLNDWLSQARRRATIKINEPFRFGALRTEFPAN